MAKILMYFDCSFPDSQRHVILSGFGYCPLTKQYKVLSIFYYVCGGLFRQTPVSGVKAAIITVGHSNSLWRITDIPTTNYIFSDNETLCINGTFYWLSYSKDRNQYQYHHITAFNVNDETFHEISLPPQVNTYTYPSKTLYSVEHEGRLCLVDFAERNEKYLDTYIMLENHRWEFRFRVFFEDFQQYVAYDSYPESVSCLEIGKILVYSHCKQEEPSPISHSNGDDSNGDASAIRTATLRRFERRRFSDSNGDASAIRTATLRLLRTATLRLPRTATLRLLELRRFAFLEPATLCRPSHRRRFEVSFQLPSSPILVVANLDPFVADSRRF
nr:f-box protein [Quercus suber]